MIIGRSHLFLFLVQVDCLILRNCFKLGLKVLLHSVRDKSVHYILSVLRQTKTQQRLSLTQWLQTCVFLLFLLCLNQLLVGGLVEVAADIVVIIIP